MKAELGPVYRERMDLLWAGPYAPRIAAAEADHEVGGLRHVRLSDRALGRRGSDPGGGGVIPEPLG